MKRLILYLLLLVAPYAVHAQFDKLKDSVVEIYGVVMTADSLKAIPAVSVTVKDRNQGTYTSDQGVFSLVVLKGDVVEFSSVGYKTIDYKIPYDSGNQISMIQLMVIDAKYLPATIIKPRPTREQFERDFVNNPVPDDDIEIARQNNSAAKRAILARGLPANATEAASTYLRQGAQKYYYQGQAPPQNILNPLAWAEFIQAWKRGDFRNDNTSTSQ
ncbi:MAG TPA: carboxypeptidase-like regulatory domain-containing protein [Puia sp.]|nr:carboxypeptidase-like regulatory domain-containing protein [Puia sp.]